MSFSVLIPARLSSSRLPGKPLADLGGKPMVVRVAERALQSGARQVVVATDAEAIQRACAEHGVQAILTRDDHQSGSDRLAEACMQLGLDGNAIVVNVQGDEPLIDPALIRACAEQLIQHPDCVTATAAHAIHSEAELRNPNVVKVVLDQLGRALYFSRASIPWWRDGSSAGLPALTTTCLPLRHIGIYAYRAGYLRSFPALAASPLEQVESLEQLRILWHGDKIAVHVTDTPPPAGVDTPEDLTRVRQHYLG